MAVRDSSARWNWFKAGTGGDSCRRKAVRIPRPRWAKGVRVSSSSSERDNLVFIRIAELEVEDRHSRYNSACSQRQPRNVRLGRGENENTYLEARSVATMKVRIDMMNECGAENLAVQYLRRKEWNGKQTLSLTFAFRDF